MADAVDKKIRVLVVDDSAFMCKVLQDLIHSDPALEVVGQARDGREGVTLADSLCPDVITMDINMPHVDGLQATEMIMSRHPRPIVIVSSESREGAATTLRALDLGAVDFVPKPSSGIDLDMRHVRDELTRKLKMAAKVRVVRTATRAKSPTSAAPAANSNATSNVAKVTTMPLAASGGASSAAAATGGVAARGGSGGGKTPIVVVAASTGGPAAVMRVVCGLPKDLAAAVLLVLHMPGVFTKQFTVQLAEVSSLPVKEAEANELARAGTVYVCPGSQHLRFSPSGRITLDPGPRIDGYRPCADVALETVAAYARTLATAVVLTGMGSDGAQGACAVRASGGHVIAQDEATSVIFGMPGETIKSGAANEVLPLDEIAAAISKRVARLARLVPAGVR